MKVRITAPCQIGSEWVDVGKIIDIQKPGTVSRLIHLGQAVPAEPEPEADQADGETTPKKGEKQ